MKVLLFFAFLICGHMSAIAQTDPSKAEDKRGQLTPRETSHHLAHQSIAHLKSGVLLVRLQTRSQAIAALIDRGDTARAHALRQEQETKNLEIATAFASEFDFCPVYFFYADASTPIQERDFGKVDFFNALLQPEPNASVEGINFLVAEMGKSQPRRSDVFNHYYMNDQGVWVHELYDNPNKKGAQLSGLVVMNNQFQRLSKPFPYLVRNFGDTFWRRSPPKTVRRFNGKVHAFARMHGL